MMKMMSIVCGPRRSIGEHDNNNMMKKYLCQQSRKYCLTNLLFNQEITYY